MNTFDNERYVSVRDVRRFLGVSDTGTVVAWLKAYGAKLIQIKNKERTTTRVWKPDLDRFIEDHTVKPEPKPEKRLPGRPPRFQLAK